MNFPFCLPIQRPREDEVVKNIEENTALYRYFEVWLGAIESLDDAFLGTLLSLCGPSLVVVLRSKGQEITLPLARRKFFIDEMAGSEAYLDLDVTVQRPEIAYWEKHGRKVKSILSYHNYQETPSLKKLRGVAGAMKARGASVSKIATFCRSPAEALRLLEFGEELKAQEDREYIVLGMGAHGAVTRIFGTLWGNKMVFAPREPAFASAPGQLTLKELEQILGILKPSEVGGHAK